MTKTIELGDRVKEKITGYTGIAICVAQWLNGCIRIVVQPEKLKAGDRQEDQNFDVGALDIVKKGVFAPVTLTNVPAPKVPAEHTTGGPSLEGSGFKRR